MIFRNCILEERLFPARTWLSSQWICWT